MKNHNNPQPVSLKQLGMEMSKTKIYWEPQRRIHKTASLHPRENAQIIRGETWSKEHPSMYSKNKKLKFSNKHLMFHFIP